MNSGKLLVRKSGSLPLNTGKLISAHYLEIDYLLERVEGATTHYQALGLERSAAAEEIIAAYQNSIAVLHPSYHKVRAAVSDDMLVRIDNAFKKLSQAFSDLTDANKRAQYDNVLNPRSAASRPRETPRTKKSFNTNALKDETSNTIKKNPVPASVADQINVAPEFRAVFTKSATQPATSERRRCERFKLSVPALIAGYDHEGGKWQEVAKTVDVGRMGVAVRMCKQLKHGLVVHITLPLPTKLRSHGFSEQGYNMYAIVRRVEPLIDGKRVVGLEFIGATPPADYLHKPWSVFRTQKWDGGDRRREPREKLEEPVAVEYLDEAMRRISREAGVTENVSRGGARVRVKSPPPSFEFIRVTCPKLGFNGLALLRNQWTGDDGARRLCLQFVDQKWPLA